MSAQDARDARDARDAQGDRRTPSRATGVADAPLLLEREYELGAVDGAIAAAAAGVGQIVLVHGPPGAGKTRLVAHARATATREGLRVLDARGAELEQGFAFGVARRLLEPVVAGAGDEREALFAGAAGLTRRLFEPARASDGLDDATFATLHGLYWLVVNLADRAPVLLAVDDAHWADEGSLRFLDYLAHRTEGLALAMVIAGRPPGDAEAELWRRVLGWANARAVTPRPLSAAAVTAVVRERLGPDADPDFCAACHLATRGNPLFVRELLAALAARDVAPSAGGVAEVTAVGPAAVSRFVLARLRAVGAEATELARAVAVLGDDAKLAHAGRVAGLGDEEARSVADALVRADVLDASQRLRFVHPIVRAATYDALAPGEREARHAAAARVLEREGAPPESVAAHLERSGSAMDAAAVSVLRAAAASAEARGAPTAAAALLRRALEGRPTGVDRAPMLVDLGRCELAAGRFEAAEEQLRAALALGGDGPTRARAASLLGRCAIASGGRAAEAAADVLEALAGERAGQDPEGSLVLEGELLVLTTTVSRLRARLPERLARFRERAAGDRVAHAAARVFAAEEALLRGEPAAPAADEIEAALADGLTGWTVATIFVALYALALAERFELITPLLDAGLERAREEGHAARQAVIHSQRAVIALARGALGDALVEAQTGLTLAGDRHFALPRLAAVAIVVHIERGELEAAEEAVERGGALGEAEDRVFLDDYLVARGRLRLARGELREGVADLLGCGARWTALGLAWPDGWRAFAAPALAALGEHHRAQQLAREQLALARRVGAPGALGRALRTSGVAVGGEEGLALLEEAVAVLERGPARLEHAYALTDLGVELSRRRRRREGREALRLGMGLAVRCGAVALAERARAELEAGGGRRARLELTGVDALTPAERRVCDLAASGELTNRAIAQSLFVTEKTVELHLRNAYRKLAIRSRFQLAGALRA